VLTTARFIKGLVCGVVAGKLFIQHYNIFAYAKAGLTYMGVGRNLSYKKSVFSGAQRVFRT